MRHLQELIAKAKHSIEVKATKELLLQSPLTVLEVDRLLQRELAAKLAEQLVREYFDEKTQSFNSLDMTATYRLELYIFTPEELKELLSSKIQD